ncbi:MAG: hypothetical protein QM757_21505 [Paludibaculum sp.]
MWKFVKQEALANRWRADFPAFRATIDATLDQLHTTHRDKMRSLLTLHFQVLEPVFDSGRVRYIS